MSIYDDEEP